MTLQYSAGLFTAGPFITHTHIPLTMIEIPRADTLHSISDSDRVLLRLRDRLYEVRHGQQIDVEYSDLSVSDADLDAIMAHLVTLGYTARKRITKWVAPKAIRQMEEKQRQSFGPVPAVAYVYKHDPHYSLSVALSDADIPASPREPYRCGSELDFSAAAVPAVAAVPAFAAPAAAAAAFAATAPFPTVEASPAPAAKFGPAFGTSTVSF
jgi:hypothetical protein